MINLSKKPKMMNLTEYLYSILLPFLNEFEDEFMEKIEDYLMGEMSLNDTLNPLNRLEHAESDYHLSKGVPSEFINLDGTNTSEYAGGLYKLFKVFNISEKNFEGKKTVVTHPHAMKNSVPIVKDYGAELTLGTAMTEKGTGAEPLYFIEFEHEVIANVYGGRPDDYDPYADRQTAGSTGEAQTSLYTYRKMSSNLKKLADDFSNWLFKDYYTAFETEESVQESINLAVDCVENEMFEEALILLNLFK